MKAVLLAVVCFLIFLKCNQKDDQIHKITGEAQGTTYQITYVSPGKENYKKEIDSLLSAVDLSLSTYVPHSIISRINKNDSDVIADKYFTEVFNKAQEISKKTEGVFEFKMLDDLGVPPDNIAFDDFGG